MLRCIMLLLAADETKSYLRYPFFELSEDTVWIAFSIIFIPPLLLVGFHFLHDRLRRRRNDAAKLR